MRTSASISVQLLVGLSCLCSEPTKEAKGFRLLQGGKCFVNMDGPTSKLYREAKSQVFTKLAAFQEFWLGWRSLAAPLVDDAGAARAAMLKNLPEVDFTKEVVVFVVGRASERPTHRIEVVEAVTAGGAVTLKCKEFQGAITGAAMQSSRPYQFVAVPKPPTGDVKIAVEFVPAPKLKGPLPPMAPGGGGRGGAPIPRVPPQALPR